MEVYQFLLVQWATQVGQMSLSGLKQSQFKVVMDGDTLWISLWSICAH